MAVRLLVIPGSTRRGAFSKQLAAAALAQVGDRAEATLVDLREHAMPLYDGDVEEQGGLPAGALTLRPLVADHDAVLFVTPEYNASIPAVLKNAIDWLSRPHAADPAGQPWAGKVAGLLASSPGALGGLRGLVHLRQIAMNVGMQVVTEQYALGSAQEAFAADGALRDARAQQGVEKVLLSLLRITAALRR